VPICIVSWNIERLNTPKILNFGANIGVDVQNAIRSLHALPAALPQWILFVYEGRENQWVPLDVALRGVIPGALNPQGSSHTVCGGVGGTAEVIIAVWGNLPAGSSVVPVARARNLNFPIEEMRRRIIFIELLLQVSRYGGMSAAGRLLNRRLDKIAWVLLRHYSAAINLLSPNRYGPVRSLRNARSERPTPYSRQQRVSTDQFDEYTNAGILLRQRMGPNSRTAQRSDAPEEIIQKVLGCPENFWDDPNIQESLCQWQNKFLR
jgi:hypothetical protein